MSSIEGTMRFTPRSEQVRCGVLIEAVHGVISHHVAPGARELDRESDMARKDGQIEREPLFERGPILGAHDRRRAQAQRDASSRKFGCERANAR